jgi:hypothetical protein
MLTRPPAKRLRMPILIRFPPGPRILGATTTLYLGYTIFSRKANYFTDVVFVVLLIMTVHAYTYRIKITTTEISIRFFPLFNRLVRMADIRRIIDRRPLVIATTSSRLHLWFLTTDARNSLFHVLPRHLVVDDEKTGNKDPAIAAARYWKWTKLVGSLFLLSVVTLVPFLEDNPWNKYWYPIGACLAIVGFALFLSLIYTGGMAYIHWQADRELHKTR